MFSIPFFKKKRNVLGVDIGSCYVKVMELTPTKSGYSLSHFGISKLPPEAIIDGAFMNRPEIIRVIRELLDRYKIKTKDLVTSISGHSVIIKKISLPTMTEEELEESIQWEAEQYIPFDINDVNLDVQILSTGMAEMDQMEVILVAAKKDMIQDYVSLFSEMGLNLVVVDVDSFAIANMFELNYGIQQDLTVALVNIGASTININILKNGITAFTRDISLGGNQFTEEIQKQLNVTYDEAESLKIGGERVKDDQSVVPHEIRGILESVGENIAVEIQRSFDFYTTTSAEDRISKVYLCGGAAKTPGLSNIISKKTDIEIEFLDPFKRIEVNDRLFNRSYLQEVAPIAGVVLGLSLRREGDK